MSETLAKELLLSLQEAVVIEEEDALTEEELKLIGESVVSIVDGAIEASLDDDETMDLGILSEILVADVTALVIGDSLDEDEDEDEDEEDDEEGCSEESSEKDEESEDSK